MKYLKAMFDRLIGRNVAKLGRWSKFRGFFKVRSDGYWSDPVTLNLGNMIEQKSFVARKERVAFLTLTAKPVDAE